MRLCNTFALGYLIYYNNELFPVSIRGFTLGLSFFVGRMLLGFFPFMNTFLDNHDLHRLTGLIPLSLVALLFALKLPETLVVKND